MANVVLYDDAVNRLSAQSQAIGHLAQDAGAFAATVAAFEARDSDAFRWVLERVEMLPYCELVCEWIRVKLGVLRSSNSAARPKRRRRFPICLVRARRRAARQ